MTLSIITIFKECHNAECRDLFIVRNHDHAECYYAECRYAEC